jgi:exodeoxyribonuclease-3
MLRVISFNANGIRAAVRRGFYEWLLMQDADFVCIQETKAHIDKLKPYELYFPAGFFCKYLQAQKKGYSGVAIYAKKPPLRVIKQVGFAYCDDEARYLQFDYDKLSIISLYLPSGASSASRQAVKMQCLAYFTNFFTTLKKEGRSLIICGDYNIAHQCIDLRNWRSNQKTPGFLPEERAWLDYLFGSIGLVDAFRVLNKEEGQYTWWSYRQRAWEKNIGWRIDYQIVTPDLASCVHQVTIKRDGHWSDHAPVIIDYEL